jgi:hypothetical protein
MRCHKRQRVCLRPLNQHTSIGHGARHTSGISGSSLLGQAFCFRLANLAKLIKLFHLELHDTEQIELQNHNGALFVLYRTIYARHRSEILRVRAKTYCIRLISSEREA